ncbi:AraC family transcriptional regulator [Sphingobacterium sp. BIGb0165]|uniref:AraC family transcriptional regulator n=1 Tax=Sphingobacterium sp. BIGb0165 TaxID=2940615 RepID=UPI0021697280|nr:AraC family transcriptional regulator [Sphingobacterium sp. BIGb0165]MCS4226948.1 AraC-like DNA-binding protein [Sphingobacterium sp. BIGb0165]
MIDFKVKYHEGTGNLKIDRPVKNDYYTVLICYTGSTSIVVGFHKFELSPNVITIIPPDVIFSISNVSNDLDLRQILFVKTFLQKMFLKEGIIDELLLLNANYPPLYKLNERFQIVADRFIAVKRELELQSAYHLDITRLILMEILYEYNRACEYCLLGFEKNMNRNYQLTYEFKRLVDQYFSKWKTIGQYASKLNISAKHLTEVVKEETGHTALQIIHERLLLESQYLLKHTTISVKECASSLGFETASYFSRFFKSHMTISPNDYRKKM